MLSVRRYVPWSLLVRVISILEFIFLSCFLFPITSKFNISERDTMQWAWKDHQVQRKLWGYFGGVWFSQTWKSFVISTFFISFSFPLVFIITLCLHSSFVDLLSLSHHPRHFSRTFIVQVKPNQLVFAGVSSAHYICCAWYNNEYV